MHHTDDNDNTRKLEYNYFQMLWKYYVQMEKEKRTIRSTPPENNNYNINYGCRWLIYIYIKLIAFFWEEMGLGSRKITEWYRIIAIFTIT